METTLYVDYLSQPSRAVCLLNRCANLGAVEHTLRLRGGEQRTEAYKALSPLAKVPLLVERAAGGASAGAASFLSRSSAAAVYSLPESCAILRYLCSSRRLNDHWYPGAHRQRAAVDAALDWHHSTLRRGASTLVFERLFKGNDAAAESDSGVRDALALLQAALRQLDAVWLAAPGRFLCGAQQLSIADLVLACEVAQLRLLSCSAAQPGLEQLLAPHARVRAWLGAVEEAAGPHWAAVNAKIDGLAAAGTGARSKL